MRLLLTICCLALSGLPAFGQDATPKTLDRNAQRIVNDATRDLKDKDGAKRVAALDNLASWGGVVTAPLVIGALKDADPRVRAAAADALWNADMKTEVARPALVAALSDPSPDVAGLAAGALGLYKVPLRTRQDAFQRALRGATQLRVRFMAARALVGVASGADLVAPMTAYLAAQETARMSTGRDSAREALEALAATGDTAATAGIAQAVSSVKWGGDVLLNVLVGAKTKPTGWTDLLVRESASRSADVRRVAMHGLRAQVGEADLAKWTPIAGRLAASDPDPGVRMAAFSALELGAAGGGHAQAPVALTAARMDKDADVRQAAFQALATIVNRSGTAPQLVKASMARTALPEISRAIVSDPDADVRASALGALDALALPSAEAATLLAGIAKSSADDAIRTRALALLRNRGPEARNVQADVQALTSDSSETVREMARTALERMGPSGPAPRTGTATPVSPDAEARALALLRARKIEFDEDQFYKAISDTDVALVQAFLDAGMSASRRFTISRKEAPIAVALSSSGCSPTTRPTAPATLAVVRLLIARGATASFGDENTHTPLMEGAMNGCDAVVMAALIKAGADVNAKGQAGLTAFELGLWSGHDGLDAIIAAGYRLTAENAKVYQDAYKANPASLAMIRKATRR